MSLYRRHTLAPIGIGLVAVALADRLAFYTSNGAVFLLLGVLFLALAATAPDRPDSEPIVYPPLLLALTLLAAVTPEEPERRAPAVVVLPTGGGVACYVCTWGPERL